MNWRNQAAALIELCLLLGAAVNQSSGNSQGLNELKLCREVMGLSRGDRCSRSSHSACQKGLEYRGIDCTCHRCPQAGERPSHPVQRVRLRCISLLGLCEPPEVTTASPLNQLSCQRAYLGSEAACGTAAVRGCPADSYLTRGCSCEMCPSRTTFSSGFKLDCLQLLGFCHGAQPLAGGETGTNPDQATTTLSEPSVIDRTPSTAVSGNTWRVLLIILCVLLIATPIVAVFAVQRLQQQRYISASLNDAAARVPLDDKSGASI
ncbi:hypothetical protein BOX15_Mlig018243g1 [Macrostomum lignano]|uniref:TNFR-Cys domain-containing protein n=2 Tax=Macrostomum lignano TaxID=282301 RepID=A0A1I8HF80_9PLAT|nr:hypothetical protein BOX15_Mlig018243g1 [Macrostomum lignano]